MIHGRRVEQVFVRRRQGRIELLLVLEDASGARSRETWPMADADAGEAVRRLARQLARRGDVDGFTRLRVRRERGGGLEDDAALARILREAWHEERSEA